MLIDGDASVMPEYRTALITVPKTGSQWVRDVLSAPSIASRNGFFLVKPLENELDPLKNPVLFQEQWREAESGSFFAPVYDISFPIWQEVADKNDRAVIILRDPRDMLVSWMYSQCYSHTANRVTGIWRNLMLSVSIRARLALSILRFNVWKETYDSWSDNKSNLPANVYVTSYENILNQQVPEFSKIARFLGWQVGDDDISKVVAEFSFYKRSGRKQGDENSASHYRKGIAGDWKNYFDRKSGGFFEALYPSLLKNSGYENSIHWYEELKNNIETDETHPGNVSQGEIFNLKAEVDRLTAKLREESQVSQTTIQSLSEAAHDRKILCEKLVIENQKKEEEINRKEVEITRKEEEINKKEAEINKKEEEIINKEEEINKKEAEINRLASAVKDLQAQSLLQGNEINKLYNVCKERLELIERLSVKGKKKR